MKLISWNVNGLRAILKKDFDKNLAELDADVLCLQETKAQDSQVEEALQHIKAYEVFHNDAERKGYSGVALFTKVKPISISRGIGIEEHDKEGRVLTAEFDKFFLVNVYVPNSGQGLARLDYRQKWDADFLNYLTNLEKSKPVVVCGDLNVAHEEIDIARPKSNYNKTAGYTQKEIDGFDHLIEKGFTDTFRSLHPETVKYSWWSYRMNARQKNIGWRIDYFLVSEKLKSKVSEASIHNEMEGSDHCPIELILDV